MTRPLINGPDDAMRLAWRLREKQESPTGCNPFLMKGRVAAENCTNCGHNRRHEVRAKRGNISIDRCMRCGAVWSFHVECALPSSGQISSRPYAFDRRLVELADLQCAIGEVPEDDRRLYKLYLMTDRSYEDVAVFATELALEDPQRWTMPPRGFTLNRVRGAVGRARDLLRAALTARGLMAHSLPVLMLDGGRETIDAIEPLPIEVLVPADPVTWFELLQDFAIPPEAMRDCAAGSGFARLSRGTTRKLGTVYRQVPLWKDYP